MAGINGKAEKKKYKEISMEKKSEMINVSANDLWEIIGPGFDNVGAWSTAVDHAVGSGSADLQGAPCKGRICEVNAKGFDKLSETLTEYDEQNQRLAYVVDQGMPGFVTLASNHWDVIDLGNGKSALQMKITMHTKKFMGALMGGMMKKNINKTLDSVMRDLKIYAETGNISKEKEDRMAKLARSN